MLIVAPVNIEHRVPIAAEQQELMARDPDLRRRVNVVRSTIPAVTHVDYSARVQTVDAERNPRDHKLIKAFEAQTGSGVVNWQWSSYSLQWSGPVTKEQKVRFWLVGPWGNLLLNFLRVILVALLAGVACAGPVEPPAPWAQRSLAPDVNPFGPGHPLYAPQPHRDRPRASGRGGRSYIA